MNRPYIGIPGRKQVPAYRVIAAWLLDRPIEAHEDVHHTCENGRCVRPTHLMVEDREEHSKHHAEQLRLAGCPRHETPWDAFNIHGHGVCYACARLRTQQWRERTELATL